MVRVLRRRPEKIIAAHPVRRAQQPSHNHRVVARRLVAIGVCRDSRRRRREHQSKRDRAHTKHRWSPRLIVISGLRTCKCRRGGGDAHNNKSRLPLSCETTPPSSRGTGVSGDHWALWRSAESVPAASAHSSRCKTVMHYSNETLARLEKRTAKKAQQ